MLFVGKNDAGRVLEQHIEAACHTDVSVLIVGEHGVGKRRVARLIHEQSGPIADVADLPQEIRRQVAAPRPEPAKVAQFPAPAFAPAMGQ